MMEASIVRDEQELGGSVDADVNTDSCLACSKAGLYEIALHGIYADFSWDF